MRHAGGVIAGIVAAVLVLAVSGLHATPYDNYVLLADAFRHGRVWIDWPGPYIDALSYAGRYYVIEAPLPAVLLLPAVVLRGTAVNQSILAAIASGVAIYAGWEIARTLGTGVRTRALLCAFLLLGTDLFWCAMLGDVWFLAQVCSVAFTLLALLETLGLRRGWLVALFAACAIESRFTLLTVLPVYAALLWFGTGVARTGERDDRRTVRLTSFALTLVPFAIAWLWYNELRWGVPYDIGYTAWYHQDSAGMSSGSPFRLSYLPMQFYSFFVRSPDRIATYPYLIPSIAGVALTWTSPGLLLALFARSPRLLTGAMWAATVLAAVPNFLYYVNGYAQFGMRHALDFEPFLFVLMVVAARRSANSLGAWLVSYSVLAGAWGVWYWRTFLRH